MEKYLSSKSKYVFRSFYNTYLLYSNFPLYSCSSLALLLYVLFILLALELNRNTALQSAYTATESFEMMYWGPGRERWMIYRGTGREHWMIYRESGREYWTIYRRPGFRAVHPTPSPVGKLDWRHTEKLRKRDNLLTGAGGREWARSKIMRPEECLVLYKSFNTLWDQAFSLSYD